MWWFSENMQDEKDFLLQLKTGNLCVLNVISVICTVELEYLSNVDGNY